jgi:hypothetical protein
VIATFAIGNSDDKFSQGEWSRFVRGVHIAADHAVLAGARIHFAGHSAPWEPWQNALWAIELPDHDPGVRQALRHNLRTLADTYRQDSVAWWESNHVEMLEPAA